MKIREILFTTALLVTAIFASCSKSPETPKDDVESTIAFAIAIPKGDPITYAIHDSEEWTMGSLWMYEFNADGSKLLADPIDISADLHVNVAEPNYIYKRQITNEQKGSRRFVFVANEKPAGISVAANSTLQDLEALLAQKVLATNGTSKDLLQTIGVNERIPMTGVAVQAGSPVIAVTGTTNTSIKVQMTRIVARIDVKVNAPNLVVTDLKLVNTNSHSHLFLTGDYETPDANNTKVSNIGTFADVSILGTENVLQKAFYLYEGHQRASNSDPASIDDAVKVIVSAKLGGVPVVYTIPFWQNGSEVVVKRNYLYRIDLGDEDKPIEPNTNVKFTINVLDWNEILMNETYDVITAEYQAVANTSYEKVDGELKGVLTVDNAVHSDMKFTFANQFKNHYKYDVKKSDNSATWATASFSGDVLTIGTTANDTGVERSVDIIVNSDVEPNTIFVITVKQAG